MLQAIFAINPLVLATSLGLLVIALGLATRRRLMMQRYRRQRLAEEEAQAGDGETSVLPLAHLASAVEVLDLDDLLAGEEGSIAAAARRALEAPTDVSTAPDTFFPLPKMPVARSTIPVAPAFAAAAPIGLRAVGAANLTEAVAQASPPPARAAAAPAAAKPIASSSTTTAETAVPVRELALAWFEARGYRPSSASQAVRPIELVLRHRKDPARAYAFIVERERLTAERVAVLVDHARSIGLTKVLVAVETTVDPDTRHRFRRQGVRLVDQAEMRREFDKLDLRVAAKIIAVARGRSQLQKAR